MICDELHLECCEQIVWDFYAPRELEYGILRVLIVGKHLPKFLGGANVS